MAIQQSLTAELLYPAGNILGENPLWDAVRNSVFWIDIEGKVLYELSWLDKKVKQWIMPQRLGMAVHDENHDLILGLQQGLALFSLKTYESEWLMNLEKDLTNNRPNDGNCDSKGRLWIGTMDINALSGAGFLYCVNENKIVQQLDKLTIANGKAWSLDNKYFYFTDSITSRIDAYLFDENLGSISFYKTIVNVPDELGLPDGMTIDQEGMLWVAHWDGFCVCRWNPETGELLKKIELPVPKVSSCTFGGPELDTLIITTAKAGLSPEELEKYPLSGHVFRVKPGIKGVKPHLFKHKKES